MFIVPTTNFYSSSDCFIGTYRRLPSLTSTMYHAIPDTYRQDQNERERDETQIDCYFGTGTYIRPI